MSVTHNDNITVVRKVIDSIVFLPLEAEGWENTKHTGVGQNNGNITDAVHVSSLILCWTTICLQYSHSPSWNGLIQVLNMEFYIILLEEHLQVTLEMLAFGICFSL
jgi:hypothetical protein